MQQRSFIRRLPGKIVTPINRKIGQKVYGNIANLSDNLIGSHRWNNNKKACNANISQSEEAKQLVNDGCGIYPYGFKKEIIDEIYAEYNKVIHAPKHSEFSNQYAQIVPEEDGTYRSRIINALESVPSGYKLFTDEFIGFVEQYYQSHFRLHSCEMWQTRHISQEHLDEIYPLQPYSILWHVDGHPTDTLKFFLVLSDVTDDHGPLHFLNKERTSEILKKGYRDRFNYNMPCSELEDSRYLNKLTGKSGTAGFVNVTQCLHRAGVPIKGNYRDILEFRLESSDTPFKIPG
ncbi:MAG: hypothetical protein PQ612_09425 [Rickettsiales bacterium]|nr:hypothetical protein [Pseudomonadota bacterium]MDG4544193.1 hypothetical protein [Rickettsiales bacterium]PIR39885.1 MAG: hypothetical protein COV35_00245 [Alphaproteobacteria bacterium CG11_big_fil_rev_8_21_14_0_20_39_49]MDA0967439.1 hypothetical protein [Pseudomonadota bacterium]MDG4546374.1 hypothetical protein [Rickettsiales bacterium]